MISQPFFLNQSPATMIFGEILIGSTSSAKGLDSSAERSRALQWVGWYDLITELDLFVLGLRHSHLKIQDSFPVHIINFTKEASSLKLGKKISNEIEEFRGKIQRDKRSVCLQTGRNFGEKTFYPLVFVLSRLQWALSVKSAIREFALEMK